MHLLLINIYSLKRKNKKIMLIMCALLLSEGTGGEKVNGVIAYKVFAIFMICAPTRKRLF